MAHPGGHLFRRRLIVELCHALDDASSTEANLERRSDPVLRCLPLKTPDTLTPASVAGGAVALELNGGIPEVHDAYSYQD